MKKLEITIDGKAFPCSPSMGAMLRFKRETGKEINEIDPTSFTELCTYLWCCAKSAANREKIAFDYTLMDFADSITPEEMARWSGAIMTEAEPDSGGKDEKKSL